MLSATLREPLPLQIFAWQPAKLHCGELGPFADRSGTEMAPKKGKKKGAGPTKTRRTITRSTKMETKLNLLGELEMRFAGVAKALRPALAELAGRTAQQLDHPTYHKDGRRKAQYDALIAELGKVRDSNIALRVAYHETHRELKAESVQHETLQEMIAIENRYRVIDLS